MMINNLSPVKPWSREAEREKDKRKNNGERMLPVRCNAVWPDNFVGF